MKVKGILIMLVLAVAIMMAPISASATFYTDRAAWLAAVGTSADVNLPGTTGDTLPQYSTQIPLPYGGFYNFGVPLLREDVGNPWATWNPQIAGTELLYAYQSDSNGNFTANFTFYPDGSTNGPVSAFGFEAEPEQFSLFTILLFTVPGYNELYQTVNGQGGAKFFGWVDEPITGFSVISYAGSNGFAMGRFVEGGTAVPEPSTLLLFGSGLAGFGLFRRKLKK